MNEPIDGGILRLKQILEEATMADPSVTGQVDSAREVNGEPADTETAALRKTWQSLEQLIWSADASLPAMAAVHPDDRLETCLTVAKSRGGGRPGLVAVTAAMLLVAVACGWWTSRHGSRGGPEDARTIATEAPSQSAPRSAAVKKQPKTGTTKTSTWDDPPERQIALLSQQITDVEENWRHRVDDVDLVQYRINEVAELLQRDAI